MSELAKATGREAPAPAPHPGTVARQERALPERHGATLADKLRYAQALAQAGLLPRAYQHQPANILFGLEYGETLGISTMAAIMGIHVIDGKPCASSALISALVRRAGHRLRVSGDEKSATCTIIRADDPEYKFTFTWTMTRAQQAGLTGKQVWKNYPAAMLMARAITECARAAAQDVLFGLAYTPEELGADALDDDFIAGEVIIEAPEEDPRRKIQELLIRHGIEDPGDQLEALSVLVDRNVGGTRLTEDEIEFVAGELEALPDEEGALQKLLEERKAASA